MPFEQIYKIKIYLIIINNNVHKKKWRILHKLSDTHAFSTYATVPQIIL